MRELNPEIFINPGKFKRKISVEKIVADPKVSHRGVKRYKEMLAEGKDLGTIIVIKHPREEVYAVVDGHHRFYAQSESGVKEIDCAVVGNFSSFMFHLTKNGWFQPSKEVTDHVRIPMLRFQEHLKEFLKEFLKNPDKFKKSFKFHRPLNKGDKMNKLMLIALLSIVLLSACVEQPPEQPTTTVTTATTELTTTVETTTITTTTEEHHGLSTLGNCTTDGDCYTSGCNSEICQSKFETPMVSICVYDPPYPDDLGYECKCVDKKCMWVK